MICLQGESNRAIGLGVHVYIHWAVAWSVQSATGHNHEPDRMWSRGRVPWISSPPTWVPPSLLIRYILVEYRAWKEGDKNPNDKYCHCNLGNQKPLKTQFPYRTPFHRIGTHLVGVVCTHYNTYTVFFHLSQGTHLCRNPDDGNPTSLDHHMCCTSPATCWKCWFDCWTCLFGTSLKNVEMGCTTTEDK